MKPERGQGLVNRIENMVCNIFLPTGEVKVPYASHYSIYDWMMMEQACEDDLDLPILPTPTAATSRLHVATGFRPCLKPALVDLHQFVSAGHRPCLKFPYVDTSGFDSAGHRPRLKLADVDPFGFDSAGHRPCFKFALVASCGFDSAGHRPCLMIVIKDVTAARRRAVPNIVVSPINGRRLSFSMCVVGTRLYTIPVIRLRLVYMPATVQKLVGRTTGIDGGRCNQPETKPGLLPCRQPMRMTGSPFLHTRHGCSGWSFRGPAAVKFGPMVHCKSFGTPAPALPAFLLPARPASPPMRSEPWLVYPGEVPEARPRTAPVHKLKSLEFTDAYDCMTRLWGLRTWRRTMARVHIIFLDVFATFWSVGLYLKLTNENRYRDTIGIQRIFTELNLEKG